MKIKAKEVEKGSKFDLIKKGDWIDLRAAETVEFAAPKYIYKEKRVAFDSKVIKLGVAMKLPAGLEAVVVARSGLYKLHPVLVRNSMGVIDNSYSGNTDEWKLPLIAMEATTIKHRPVLCRAPRSAGRRVATRTAARRRLRTGVPGAHQGTERRAVAVSGHRTQPALPPAVQPHAAVASQLHADPDGPLRPSAL